MKRGRIFILLAIIIILGLVAAYFVQRQFLPGLTGTGESVSGEPGPTPVVATSETSDPIRDLSR